MSDKLRAAALLALDLLIEDDRNADRCICILEAALAKQTVQKSLTAAEQEPVAWYHNGFGTLELSRVQRLGWSPLYTAPPRREWVSLTDEEISAVDWKSNETLHDFSRAIEAKLKEKNCG